MDSTELPAERLKALARSYGCDGVCLTDPFLMVRESDKKVLCAACNKQLVRRGVGLAAPCGARSGT